MRPDDIALAVFVMALWGTNFAAIKIGLVQFPPLLMMAMRFVLVASLLLPFVRPPTGMMLPILGLAVTLGVFHFGLLTTGLTRIDAATGIIVGQLQIPFAAILAILILHERPPVQAFIGIAVAFAGVVLIAGKPDLEGHYLHLALIVAAALAWAVSNFQVKRLKRVDIFTLNAWIALFAAPMLLAASSVLESGHWEAVRDAGWRAWTALLYTVMVLIFGHGLWYRLVGRHPVSQVVPFTLLTPFFGVAAGVLVLGEELTWEIVAGGIAVVSGVAFIILRAPRRASGSPRG